MSHTCVLRWSPGVIIPLQEHVYIKSVFNLVSKVTEVALVWLSFASWLVNKIRAIISTIRCKTKTNGLFFFSTFSFNCLVMILNFVIFGCCDHFGFGNRLIPNPDKIFLSSYNRGTTLCQWFTHWFPGKFLYCIQVEKDEYKYIPVYWIMYG